MGIEGQVAIGTVDSRVLDVSRENASTSGTVNANFRFAIGVSIASENVGREQVQRVRAGRTRECLNPEIIERVANVAFAISGKVERTNPFTDARRKQAKCF